MLSHSYRSFLIMDQLRRRAGISVPQLDSLLRFGLPQYSRISKRVYKGEEGVLQHHSEQRVDRMTQVLEKGYDTDVLFETTLKRTGREIVAILGDIERTLPIREPNDYIDGKLGDLLCAASIRNLY